MPTNIIEIEITIIKSKFEISLNKINRIIYLISKKINPIIIKTNIGTLQIMNTTIERAIIFSKSSEILNNSYLYQIKDTSDKDIIRLYLKPIFVQ